MNYKIISIPIILLIFQVSLTQELMAQKNKLTLEEVWASAKFRPEFVFGIKSMNDGEHYSVLEFGQQSVSLEKYSYRTGEKVGSIFNSSKASAPGGASLMFDSYIFSRDESKLLVPTASEQIYRYSSKADYMIIDIKTGKVTPVGEKKQLDAEFSPDGNHVAFVMDNNLYVKNLLNGQTTQITADGKMNHIINGAPDWVYEEEFALKKGFYWSADSKKIAFFRFDESEVKEFLMPTYGTIYPGEYRFKYPKAGEKNAIVSIHVFDLDTKSRLEIPTAKTPENYIPRIYWSPDNQSLMILRINRHQNHLEFLLADSRSGNVKLVLEEKSETYVEVNDDFRWLQGGKQFLISSEKDGYNHIYLYDINGKQMRQVTAGPWDVLSVDGVNEKEGWVYYHSAEMSPKEKHAYAVRLNGKGKKLLTPERGTHTVEYSEGFKYYINQRSDANSPFIFELYDGKGVKIRTIKDNADLSAKLKSYDLSPKTFFSFTNSVGIELNGWMIKPTGFDPSKKYPVLMYVYGGPGHNTVNDAWEGSNYLWHQYMAQNGYLIVSIDNRGTGKRGAAFKKSTYLQLGKVETEDQIDGAKYLASLPYVDADRIAIQGWSYGGYMSSLCITKGAAFFKLAIAIAPVTNWRFYDTIYTERYMRTPDENADGYDNNSPINHVDKLKGKYLLIHGTADDNVHFQNAVEMAASLIKNNKQFDTMFYPDKNHGIYGGVTRLHLYTLITNYVNTHL
ncbi:MAG: S9 family peptidase [Flavobacteriales bacterium]